MAEISMGKGGGGSGTHPELEGKEVGVGGWCSKLWGEGKAQNKQAVA